MTEVENAALKHWRRWLLVIWVLACIAFIIMRWHPILAFGLGDTDDNMRMAQVRALLNGQDWYDLRQHKLNPPHGYNIHWTRLVDLPIAALELIIRPFFGTVIAEKAAAALAPLIPLGVAMFAMGVAVRRLVAPGAFAVAAGLMLSCQVAMLMFMPLRVDHHGWQLALLVITIAGLADANVRRGGMTMGLSSAASLTIGLELVPFLAITGGAVVLHWIWEREEAMRMRSYGAALGLGCVLGYLGFASYDNAVARCDVLSPIWLSTMLVAGGLAVGLSFLSDVKPFVRLGLAALGGAILVVGFATLWPQCIDRPEQISDELVRIWFSNVREAKPLYTQPWTTVATVISLPVVGIVGSIWAARQAWGTRAFGAWAPVAFVSVVSLLLVLWQTRQGPAAQLMGVPGATALAWGVLPRLAKHSSVFVRTFGVVGAFLVISGIATALVVSNIPDKKTKASKADQKYDQAINTANMRCPSLSAMKGVARLPATTIFTFVDLGPRLITVTHHRAIAGPYHRNGDAILDVHHAFGGSPEDARKIMLRHGATLLMTCPNMSESTVHRARHKNGFYSRLAKGEKFDWLTPVAMPKGSPLLVWSIKPENSL
jgi:hypothetical protein